MNYPTQFVAFGTITFVDSSDDLDDVVVRWVFRVAGGDYSAAGGRPRADLDVLEELSGVQIPTCRRDVTRGRRRVGPPLDHGATEAC
ncbi:hypothetical protein [Natrinema caseinilyticum]|uniref:hypothetical protein n=1 Tax=Natrinema caseinilyticum TaxID=2961570 RepID=UPI0020C324B6|nr:hypothetical protein [Natrinema caseinilyticum]